jgi:hypothetical protein
LARLPLAGLEAIDEHVRARSFQTELGAERIWGDAAGNLAGQAFPRLTWVCFKTFL